MFLAIIAYSHKGEMKNMESVQKNKSSFIGERAKLIKRHWQLYIMIFPPLLYLFIFHYLPMYGAQIAFRDFSMRGGLTGSEWVGLKHFSNFVNTYNFWTILKNTVIISVYSLLANMPIPIILALALNEIRSKSLKKTVQMITYAPHFISTVVIVSMVLQMLSPRVGIVNQILELTGGVATNIMAKPEYFRHIYVWSGVWQNMGYNAIIYIAALSAVDPTLHEAAIVDGATIFQRVIHINIPSILPTIVIILILNAGRIMNVGFEKVFLMQNSLNQETSEIISTYVYKLGIVKADFSYASAIDLFNSIINLILLVSVNAFARKFSETSLW